MGSAFVVLGAFYRPAIGELAAIAKAAVHIELPTMGVAIPLYDRAGVAACSQKSAPEAAGATRPAVRASVAAAMGNFMSPPSLSQKT